LYGRPLTVREVKKISTINEQNYNIILRDILEAAITGYPISELYVADKLYLIFWLRANTYRNANFVTPYMCKHCKRETKFAFDESAFDIKFLDETIPNTITMLVNEDTIVLDHLKISEEDAVEKFKESMKSSLSKYDEDTINIAAMIKTVNSEKLSLKGRCEYVITLDPEDYAFIQSHVMDMDFGMIPQVDAVCTHTDCRGVNEIPVSFRPEFFIPKYRT
jgi:hypothetical protein